MELLNTIQASRRLTEAGFAHTPRRVAWLARKKRFPNAVKDSTGCWYIPESDLEDYLAQQRPWSRRRSRKLAVAALATLLAGSLPVLANLSSVISAVVEVYGTWRKEPTPPDSKTATPPREETEAPALEEPPRPQPPEIMAQSGPACRPASECCMTCQKGVACGDSCISRWKTCHKGQGCACNQSEICP